MNLVISKEHFINPIVRAFGLMEGKNDDESKIIGVNHIINKIESDNHEQQR